MDHKYSAQAMELLVAYSHHSSVETRNKIVRLNLGLVRKVAHQFRHKCTEPYEDLEQLGVIGLIRAIERFDLYQGCAFSSFAMPFIRGEILHFLRDKSSTMRIPRRWQELASQAQKARKTLTTELGRSPKEQEIAEKLGISLQEWRECQLATQNRRVLSLDATVSKTTDNSITLGETLPDNHHEDLQNWQEDGLQIQLALKQLEDTTKAAIQYVYFHDLPRKEAAKQIGVSPMTVTRHIQRGIAQLTTILEPQAA